MLQNIFKHTLQSPKNRKTFKTQNKIAIAILSKGQTNESKLKYFSMMLENL